MFLPHDYLLSYFYRHFANICDVLSYRIQQFSLQDLFDNNSINNINFVELLKFFNISHIIKYYNKFYWTIRI